MSSSSVWIKLCIYISCILCTYGAEQSQQRGKVVAFFQSSCATAAPNPCQQVCTDTRSGGFYCECHEGFTINSDGMTCTGPDKDDQIDNEIVKVESVGLTKGLPKLQSGAQTRGDSNLVLDRGIYRGGFYNIPEGGASKETYLDLDIKEGGEYADDQSPQKSNTASCDGVVCGNNGTCAVVNSKSRCQCPLGTAGHYCENEIEIKYPKFDGTGYLALPALRNADKEFQVSLTFRPESSEGLVLFSAETPGAEKDFFAVVLINGFVVFRFDCGSGHAELKSASKVNLNVWNQLVITRVDNKGKLQLNNEQPIEGASQGDYIKIMFRLNLYLGGYSNMSAVSSRIATTHLFVGCIQELLITGRKVDFRKQSLQGQSEFGLNVGECSANVCDDVLCENGGTCTSISADESVCLCPLGYYGDTCTESQSVHVPQFSGYSYLEFPGLQRSVLSYTDIEIVFKPNSRNGLLLYNGFSRDRKGDFISLSLHSGFLEFRFDLGTGPAVLRSLESLAVDSWHIVRASRTGLMGTLNIDDQAPVTGQSEGAYTQLSLLEGLYLGGHPNFDHTAKLSNVTQSFSGCIQKVVINKKALDLMTGATSGMNISPCSHPCAGRPCLNEGECRPNMDMYTCYCPLGYSSTNCEETQDQLPSTPRFNGESYLMYNESKIIRRPHYDIPPPVSMLLTPNAPRTGGKKKPLSRVVQGEPPSNSTTKVVGDKMDLQMTIKPTSTEGLLLWSGEDLTKKSSRDFFALGFHARSLQLSYNLGSGEAVIIYNETNLFDGQWHYIRVQRSKQNTYLEVDKKEIVEGSSPGAYTNLNTDKILYLGGMPEIMERTVGRYTRGFGGCISSLRLATDYDVKLLAEAYTGRNIGQC